MNSTGLKMDKFLKIVLKASYYMCIGFGILPVSYNNITERFVKSKVLCLYNKFLTFIVLFVLPVVSTHMVNSRTRMTSNVVLTVFLLQHFVQWMSFCRVYYSVARNINGLIEILNEGIDLMKNLHQSTELPIRLFTRILMKHFIIDITFYSFQVYAISSMFQDLTFYFISIVIFFITANKFFFNFYLTSLYFNAFLLENINHNMESTLKTIDFCRSFKHNLTKYQYECICNDASDKIDEMSIQYSKICNFVLKSSKLFPLAVLNSLMYSFTNLLCYSFLVFEFIKFNLLTAIPEEFSTIRRNFAIIIYQIIAESINLFSFVNACDCMKIKV